MRSLPDYESLKTELAQYADDEYREFAMKICTSRLPTWTFNKTISKICDSHRVDPEVKASLRKMRRN